MVPAGSRTSAYVTTPGHHGARHDQRAAARGDRREGSGDVRHAEVGHGGRWVRTDAAARSPRPRRGDGVVGAELPVEHLGVEGAELGGVGPGDFDVQIRAAM